MAKGTGALALTPLMEKRATVRPRDEFGHEWTQQYTVRMKHGNETSIPHLGHRFCRRCLKTPLQVAGRGSSFEPCEPKISSHG